MQITAELEAKGVLLRILNLGVGTGTPTGKLILTVLGGIAQFKREIMLERQREGIAKAKREGKFKGRKPTACEDGRCARATQGRHGRHADRKGLSHPGRCLNEHSVSLYCRRNWFIWIQPFQMDGFGQM